MERRKFISTTGMALTGAALPMSPIAGIGNPYHSSAGNLIAKDVNSYLRSLIDVAEPSVDRIIIGDPETNVKKIGTAWMPYWDTCRKAVSKGINVLVVHEPAFYTHWDLDDKHGGYLNAVEGDYSYSKLIGDKKEWILKNGLVIIRCHDVWDKYPETGIPFGLGQALGFTNDQIIRSETYYNVYEIPTASASEQAKKIASKLKIAGQPGVAFYGDKDHQVSTVGLGTGCICNPAEYMHLKPDMFIAIDDAVQTWTQTTYSKDTGKPLVVINHGTSEEFGIRLLSENLAKAFPEYEVTHFNQGCTYDWIEG